MKPKKRPESDFDLEDLDMSEDLEINEDFEEKDHLTEEEEELLNSLEEEDNLPDLSAQLDAPDLQTDDSDFSFDDMADTTLPTAEEENTIIDEATFDETDTSTELPELDIEEEEIPEETKEELPEDFNDLDALEADLTNVEEDFSDSVDSLKTAAAETDIDSDSSRSILLKIEEELLSIKNDLSDLKNELSSIKSSGAADEKETAEDSSGFFEDDEDETIALTGDELDNILNTADITEESGTESEAPEEDALDFESLLRKNLLRISISKKPNLKSPLSLRK